MSTDTRQRIRTNFLESQARENSTGGMPKGMKLTLALLCITALSWGAYALFDFLTNFQTRQYIQNISIVLKNPEIDISSGNALVTVNFQNRNAIDMCNPRLSYRVLGENQQNISSGELVLRTSIPAGEERTLRQVNLGKLNGEPKRVMADITHIDSRFAPSNTSERASFPPSASLRFTEAMEISGNERIEALETLFREAPGLVSIPVAIGLAYQERGDWSRAIEKYNEALSISSNYANAHYRLAVALLHEKRIEEGLQSLKKAMELDTDDIASASLYDSALMEDVEKVEKKQKTMGKKARKRS